MMWANPLDALLKNVLWCRYTTCTILKTYITILNRCHSQCMNHGYPLATVFSLQGCWSKPLRYCAQGAAFLATTWDTQIFFWSCERPKCHHHLSSKRPKQLEIFQRNPAEATKMQRLHRWRTDWTNIGSIFDSWSAFGQQETNSGGGSWWPFVTSQELVSKEGHCSVQIPWALPCRT